MNHLKTVALTLSLLFLHTSYASSIEQTIIANTAEIIKAIATQVNNIAQSNSSIDSRIDKLESKINELQTLSMSTSLTLTQPQQRYLLFLECFAWDVLNRLKKNMQDQLFCMEPDFKRPPPSTQIRLRCINALIDTDIKNIYLKRILSAMAIASIENNRTKYDILETELESLGQTLSGTEKEEFDLYRMILGPQLIIIPE